MTLTILPYYLCFYFCRTIRFLWSTFHVFICRLEFLFCKLSAAAAANSHQSCPTLCNPIDGSPPGSPIPGILQTRTLEWVAISFSNAWKGKWKWSRSVVSDSSWPHRLQPTRLLHPWDFPGKSTGVGCHCLLWLTVVKLHKATEETTKAPNSQRNLEKGQSWRHHASGFQTILQSYDNQKSIFLALK